MWKCEGHRIVKITLKKGHNVTKQCAAGVRIDIGAMKQNRKKTNAETPNIRFWFTFSENLSFLMYLLSLLTCMKVFLV